jgi:predicted acylesterase/phospholipase RssA
MIVGTSTGGILALGLGAGRSARELLDIYVEDGGDVFPPPGWWRRKLRGFDKLLAPRYDQAALKAMLQRVLGGKQFAESSKHLCIPAYEGHHGEVHIFKTPYHPAYKKDGYDQMTAVASATAAAPTYYPAFDSGGYRYIDGGVWANCPAMIGLVDALACFDIVPSQIRVLSLGCGREPQLVDDSQARGGDWAWRYALFAAMELQTQNALGQAKLLAGPSNVVRLDPLPEEAIDLDDWTRAKDELPALAVAEFAKVKERVRETFCGEPAAQMRRFWPPAS